MAEEDDPVVHEVDVYLSKSLADNLYLYQYAKQHVHKSRDEIRYTKARVKPDFKKVELEVELNTRKNYDRSQGFDLVSGMSSRNTDSGSNSECLDKHLYESVSATDDPGTYLACKFRDNQVHMTPVRALVQMKLTVGYMDRLDSGGKGKQKNVEGDSRGEREEVGMQYQRFETDAAKARRIASYEHMSKELGSKPWINLSHHTAFDSYSKKEQDMLFAFPEAREAPQQPVPTPTFCSNILPGPTLVQETPGEETPLRRSQQKLLPLQDQIKNFLLRVHCLQLQQLHQVLQVEEQREPEVLRILPQLAVIVQACWVIKSDLVYPPDEKLKHKSAYSMLRLLHSRDFILYRLSKGEALSRDELTTTLKLPTEVVKEMLRSFARLEGEKWHFRLPYDEHFAARYPEIVQRQSKLWENRYQNSCSQLGIFRDGEKRKDNPGTMTAEKPRRRRTSSKSAPPRHRTLSGRSLSDGSDMEVDFAPAPPVQKSSVDNGDHTLPSSLHQKPAPPAVQSNIHLVTPQSIHPAAQSTTRFAAHANMQGFHPNSLHSSSTQVTANLGMHPVTQSNMQLAAPHGLQPTLQPVTYVNAQTGIHPLPHPTIPFTAQSPMQVNMQPPPQVNAVHHMQEHSVAAVPATASTVEPMEVCSRIPNGSVDLQNGAPSVESPGMVAMETKEALQMFVGEQLRQRCIFSVPELQRLLDLELMRLPPNHPLGLGMSPLLIEEAILAMGGIKLDNKWPPGQEPTPLYAYLGQGEETEKARMALLEIFTKAYRIKLTGLRTKLKDMGEEWSDDQLRKLLKSYCVTKSTMYYLKGTLPES